MTMQSNGLETFQKSFQTTLSEIYAQFGEGPLQKLRAKAWDHFLKLGLPTRKNDVYRYVKLRSFFAGNYGPTKPTDISLENLEPYILPECRQSVFVFVNGHFSPLLSRIHALPKSVTALPMIDAMRTFGGFINSRLISSLKDEKDPFAAMNAALHGQGLFLYLPPKTVIEPPIQILNIIDSNESNMLIMPRLQAFVGAQSELNLVSTSSIVSGTKYAFNMVADLNIEEDAKMHYLQVTDLRDTPVWHFEALRAVQKRNSTLKTVEVNEGSATVRFDYQVSLAGENAEASLNGACMLSGKNESHTHVIVCHEAPYCRSNQLFKCALDDASHSSFEGKIKVLQKAQKTEAFQLNNNLLLSDGANAESKPNLEIFADDVKASHGSTVGQLDEEQIFYFKTRGFSEADAKNLLVYGFCQEVVEMISVPSLYERLKLHLLKFYSKG